VSRGYREQGRVLLLLGQLFVLVHEHPWRVMQRNAKASLLLQIRQEQWQFLRCQDAGIWLSNTERKPYQRIFELKGTADEIIP
jgi:hypothetical protein